jgi:adenylate kinase family enzyme
MAGVRRAELDDQEGISVLINATPGGRGRLEDRFGEFTVSSLIYRAYLSITATDEEGNIVGFASFSATPPVVQEAEEVEGWLEWISSKEENGLYARVTNMLWLQFAVAEEGSEQATMTRILRTAFSTLPEVDLVGYTLPASIAPFTDIENVFKETPLPDPPADAVSEDMAFDDIPPEYGCRLYVSNKARFIKPLLIRDAMVEDYDDLVSVFETHSKSLKEQYGEFFLAELIESQDEQNKAIVAQANGKAMGLMSLTCEVDLSALQQCFELEPYNNLETGMSEEDRAAYDAALVAKAEEEARMAAEERKGKALCGAGPRVAILGAPGIGKSTLCKALAEEKNIIHIDFAELSDASLEGIVNRLHEEDCQAQGWILEGFPRTPEEVNQLAEFGFSIRNALIMEAADEMVKARCIGRRVDPQTGISYHLQNNPPEGMEDIEEVEARLQLVKPDDTEEGWDAKNAQYAQSCPLIKDALGYLNPPCSEELLIAADDPETIAKAAHTALSKGVPSRPQSAKSTTSSAGATGEPDDPVDERSIEERLGIAEILARDINEVKPAAFAVTLFCLDDLYEPRAKDFLFKAFMMFPDREYCVVTLPHTAAETALLQNFTMINPQPSSTFSHVLYLLHRDGLLAPELRICRALESHLEALEPMLSALPNSNEVAEAVVSALDTSTTPLSKNPQMAAFVATCRDQVLGVMVLTRKGCDASGIRWIQTAYRLEDYVVYPHHEVGEQAYITHYVINPIFSRSTRFFLREAMRLFRKTCLYYRVYPGQIIAPLLSNLVQAPPRSRPQLRPGEVRGNAGSGNEITGKDTPYAEDVAETNGENGFALHFLTLKLLSEPKIFTHSRIVVVGASDAGLSALESLMLTPYMQFSRLTLVAPNGIPIPADQQSEKSFVTSHAGGPCGYTKREIQQLSFDSTVRVINGRMVDIDREGCALQLEDETIVPYDYLLVCTGIQESTKSKLMMNTTTPHEDPRLHFLDSIEAAERLSKNIVTLASEGIQKVAVYGNTLNAFAAIQGLLAHNIPGHCIQLFVPIPPSNDADCAPFADIFVRDQVMKNLGDLGVVVSIGFVLEDVLADSNGILCGGVLNEAGEKREVEFEVLVCAAKEDVDPDVFAAINECGLVYDGRLVVDGRFRTADPAVYAAGTLTKHSRRFGRRRCAHDRFNSREVGQNLAKALMEEVDVLATPVPVDEKTGEAVPPTFYSPLGASACLPGGLYYTHIECPPLPGVGSDEPPFEFGRELITNPKDVLAKVGGGRGIGLRYCRVVLDVHRRVVGITYLGAQPIEDRNIAGLVGLQEAYVGSMEHFFDKGAIPDMAKFLRDDWAVAIYHDRFRSLCATISDQLSGNEEVQTLLNDVEKAIVSGNTKLTESNLLRKSLIGVGGEKLSYKTKKTIEAELLKFLRDNRTLLPHFCLPTSE